MKKVLDKLGNEVRVGDKIMFASLNRRSSIMSELEPAFGEVLVMSTHETHFHCGNRHIERLKEPLVHFLNLDGCTETLPSKNIVSICAIYRNGEKSGSENERGKAEELRCRQRRLLNQLSFHQVAAEQYRKRVIETL